MEAEIERVLIVEDNAPLLRSLCRTLSERFGEVRGCGTRAEAADLIARWRPQLLILDVVLPDGDAFDVLREAAGVDPAPPIIAMSGSASSDQALALQRLGVRSYIRKPLTPGALDRALRAALSGSKDDPVPPEPASRPRPRRRFQARLSRWLRRLR